MCDPCISLAVKLCVLAAVMPGHRMRRKCSDAFSDNKATRDTEVRMIAAAPHRKPRPMADSVVERQLRITARLLSDRISHLYRGSDGVGPQRLTLLAIVCFAPKHN